MALCLLLPIGALTLPANEALAAPGCSPPDGGAAVMVEVAGFRDRQGQLRVQVYRARQEEYLASGRYVARVDTSVGAAGPMQVCVPLEEPGPHVIAVLHDRDRSGRLNPFRDGVGFAGNPRLGLGKPPLDAVTVEVAGVYRTSVVLNYLQGLSVRPIAPRRAPASGP
jgi:uncharacterized protein (DUF2141 family)